MALLNIKANNLGETHRLFNKLVKEKVSDKNHELILREDDDLYNLLTIEVAAANRNVEFILEVLKGEDQLLFSRALNRSTWLITDNQYAQIINPEYLYKELFPSMTAAAINKLLLSIRLNLKDETRVEEFYNYIAIKDSKAAFKWLQHCSITFVDNEIRKSCDEIPLKVLKRLFEKSFTLFETAMSVTNNKHSVIKFSQFLTGQEPEKYLDIVEKYGIPGYYTFQAKTTAKLMSKCPERITKKFKTYYVAVHMATFAKYLKNTEKVEDFLMEQSKNENIKNLYIVGHLDHLIKFVPLENRIGLLNKLKSNLKKTKDNNRGNYYWYGRFCGLFYKFYKYAPFEIAFTELKRLIRAESKPRKRNEMLLILLATVSKKFENIRKLLQYYYKNHFNEPYQFKIDFLDAFLNETESYDFDDEMWNMLNKLFYSLEMYIKSKIEAQSCVQAIIVRHIVQGTNIPGIILSKFEFNSLKAYEKKLKNQMDKDALFSYLYNHVIKKIDNNKLESEEDFSEVITNMNNLFILLKAWDKDINQYPDVVNKIKQLILINNDKNYKRDMAFFYNINKKWRRTFFEESILLAPSNATCMNVLKHDFNILDRYADYMLTIFFNDKIPVTETLKKMRIYWPTKAKELKDVYLSKTESVDNFKALVTGLCVLLPQKELKSFVGNFAPTEEKLDWNETEERVYFMRKNISLRIQEARPLVPIGLILLYTKGDYLQYTVPSLCAALQQFSSTKSKQFMTKILDTPVSLQKIAIRYAFQKLDVDDLITISSQIWSSSKNPTIRTVVLTNIHRLLCQEKDESNIKNLWTIMSGFIDDLTSDENGIIFSKLSASENIPMLIKIEYFQKVVKFMVSLKQPKFNRDALVNRMKEHSCVIMDKLDDKFVADYILNGILNKIIKNDYFWTEENCFASYILRNKDEDTQVRRYEIFIKPLLNECINRWSQKYEGHYNVNYTTQVLLKALISSFKKITINEKMAIPIKVFRIIQSQLLENGLSYEKNYKFLTYWKLAIEMVRLIDENKNILESTEDNNDLCKELNKKIAPSFAKYCIEVIKEDVARFSPSIHTLFSSALEDLFVSFQDIFTTLASKIEYFKHMLEYEQNREVYLTVIPHIERFYDSYYDNKQNKPIEKSVLIEIQHLLFFYPSEEIKMHYYELFSNHQFLG